MKMTETREEDGSSVKMFLKGLAAGPGMGFAGYPEVSRVLRKRQVSYKAHDSSKKVFKLQKRISN